MPTNPAEAAELEQLRREVTHLRSRLEMVTCPIPNMAAYDALLKRVAEMEDATPVDEAWLLSIGFTYDCENYRDWLSVRFEFTKRMFDGIVETHKRCLSFDTVFPGFILIRDGAAVSLGIETRGQVRSLLSALGVGGK